MDRFIKNRAKKSKYEEDEDEYEEDSNIESEEEELEEESSEEEENEWLQELNELMSKMLKPLRLHSDDIELLCEELAKWLNKNPMP